MDYDGESLLVPEAVLPCQYYGGRHSGEDPEKDLLLAIFHNAINCAIDNSPTNRHQYEAIEWFKSRQADHPTRFTFLRICEVLEYNPEQWRRYVREHAAPRASIGRQGPRGLRTRKVRKWERPKVQII